MRAGEAARGRGLEAAVAASGGRPRRGRPTSRSATRSTAVCERVRDGELGGRLPDHRDERARPLQLEREHRVPGRSRAGRAPRGRRRSRAASAGRRPAPPPGGWSSWSTPAGGRPSGTVVETPQPPRELLGRAASRTGPGSESARSASARCGPEVGARLEAVDARRATRRAAVGALPDDRRRRAPATPAATRAISRGRVHVVERGRQRLAGELERGPRERGDGVRRCSPSKARRTSATSAAASSAASRSLAGERAVAAEELERGRRGRRRARARAGGRAPRRARPHGARPPAPARASASGSSGSSSAASCEPSSSAASAAGRRPRPPRGGAEPGSSIRTSATSAPGDAPRRLGERGAAPRGRSRGGRRRRRRGRARRAPRRRRRAGRARRDRAARRWPLAPAVSRSRRMPARGRSTIRAWPSLPSARRLDEGDEPPIDPAAIRAALPLPPAAAAPPCPAPAGEPARPLPLLHRARRPDRARRAFVLGSWHEIQHLFGV